MEKVLGGVPEKRTSDVPRGYLAVTQRLPSGYPAVVRVGFLWFADFGCQFFCFRLLEVYSVVRVSFLVQSYQITQLSEVTK